MPVCVSCRGSCVDSCSGRSRHAPPTSASVHCSPQPIKSLSWLWGCLSLFWIWKTPVCSRLFHGAKTFSDYISNRNNKEEKKETKNNSPGYLSLSCAPLGTWELPALSRIVVSSRRYRNLISRGANSLRPSLGCTCDQIIL